MYWTITIQLQHKVIRTPTLLTVRGWSVQSVQLPSAIKVTPPGSDVSFRAISAKCVFDLIIDTIQPIYFTFVDIILQ